MVDSMNAATTKGTLRRENGAAPHHSWLSFPAMPRLKPERDVVDRIVLPSKRTASVRQGAAGTKEPRAAVAGSLFPVAGAADVNPSMNLAATELSRDAFQAR